METLQTEVLIIGGGLSGLVAAVEARRAGRDVLLVCKRKPGRSGNTILAACNISGVFPGQGDTVEGFVQDTLWSGKNIADRALVETMAADSGAAIAFMQQLGVRFLEKDGRLHCRLVPGHGHPRTICTERVGIPVQTAGLSLTLPLLEEAERIGVRFLESTTVVSLSRHAGRVSGAFAADRRRRLLHIAAGATVLACGGGGRIFANSNNTREMTGDGFALAYQAGAVLRDLEFIQFHPAMGVSPVRVILPTTLFGDGAVLRNRYGERFLLSSVSGGEKVAGRDEMSRAIHHEIEEGRGVGGGVLLDLAEVSGDLAATRYADLWQLLSRKGGDPRSHPVTVALAVHFIMGGVIIDRDGATTVPGLLAAGEVVGGVHGANRLGGNALMEALVFGRRAGVAAASDCTEPPQLREVPRGLQGPTKPCPKDTLIEVCDEIRSLLWDGAGVVRSGLLLGQALGRWHAASERLSGWDGAEDPLAWSQASNMLTVSRLILESALFRCESRGAHYRSDYPALDDEQWLGTIQVCRGPAAMRPSVSFVRGENEPR